MEKQQTASEDIATQAEETQNKSAVELTLNVLASERAVVVGVEAKTEVDYSGQTNSNDESAEQAATLEGNLGANVLMSMRISKFDPELKVGDAEVVATLGAKLGVNVPMSMRISNFEPELKSCSRTGVDQPNVDEGLEGDEEAFSRSVLEFQRLPAYKPNGVPKLLWVCLPLVHIAIVFMGPGNWLCTSTGEVATSQSQMGL